MRPQRYSWPASGLLPVGIGRFAASLAVVLLFSARPSPVHAQRSLEIEDFRVTVAVGDTGPGITEEEKKRIFNRFYRGLVGKSSGIPGTGLGLPISKEIVERHGGRIELVSKSGEGTCFTLWLPVADQTDPNHQ